ncbi:MAG: helix-hairpin-helix domain-containing protein [Planctomycetota bacterium]|jgi:hypothetical protein
MSTPSTVGRLEDLPNVGPKIAAKLRAVGVRSPEELAENDPFELFDRLLEKTGNRCDPCVLDVFISAVRFLHGEPAAPWWSYTEYRKKTLREKADDKSPSENV